MDVRSLVLVNLVVPVSLAAAVPYPPSLPGGLKVARASTSERIRFADATSASGIREALTGIMAHAAACGDIDGDGLLDLLVAWDKWTGGRTRFYRNRGGLSFEDVTTAIGLPDAHSGLGVIRRRNVTTDRVLVTSE